MYREGKDSSIAPWTPDAPGRIDKRDVRAISIDTNSWGGAFDVRVPNLRLDIREKKKKSGEIQLKHKISDSGGALKLKNLGWEWRYAKIGASCTLTRTALLHERHTELDTAVEIGLSGTGRLHDLFSRWEAMSPGEYAAKGEGLTVHCGFLDSPFGEMLAAATNRGFCGVGFTAEFGREWSVEDMRANRYM